MSTCNQYELQVIGKQNYGAYYTFLCACLMFINVFYIYANNKTNEVL